MLLTGLRAQFAHMREIDNCRSSGHPAESEALQGNPEQEQTFTLDTISHEYIADCAKGLAYLVPPCLSRSATFCRHPACHEHSGGVLLNNE
jgi:hypothetical protein